MSDQRVHPRGDSPPRDSASSSSTATEFATKLKAQSPDQPIPHPGTYIIQIPKDQIYRVPPPENEYRFRNYTEKGKYKRSRRCRCCCWTLSTVLILSILMAIGVGVFYFIIRPQAITYSVENLEFSGFNLSSSATISPRINVFVKANNPNKRIAIDYRSGGYAAAYHNGLKLCDGPLPVFRQPRRNVTVIEATLGGSKSSGLVLGRQKRDEMEKEVAAGKVQLRISLRAPVRFKVGDVMTWTITVKVRCDVVVDTLAAGAKIVSKNCDLGFKLW